MKETALITGASSGIGYEMAKLLAQKNNNLILTARNEQKLNEIKKGLQNKYQIKVWGIPKDLSKPNSAKELYDEVMLKKIQVTTLINNAGFGNYGNFKDTDIEKELQMIQLNISSLTALTKYFLSEMLQTNYGKILNVSSILGFFPMPNFIVYAATKSYVLSFSEALHKELEKTNISVTCLCPGPTKTNFTGNSDMAEARAYKLMKQATPENVAKLGIRAMHKGKRTVIYGFKNNLLVFSTRLGTRGLVLKIANFIGKK